jgi:hypothetical protein
MNRISTLPAALSAVALVAGIAATTPAYAATTEATAQLATQNQILKGKFAFSAWRSCVETPYAPGFTPDTHTLTAEGKIVQYIESGVLTFNGAGLVSGSDISVTSMEPGKMVIGDLPVQGGLKSACKGTYAVNANRSYTAQLNCQAPLPNGMTLSMGPFFYRGHVDLSASTLTFSEQEANVQTLTVKVGGTPVHGFERICVSNGTMVRTAR